MGLFFFNVTALALLCGLEAVPAALYPRRRYLNRKALLALGFSYLCFLAMFRGAACGNDTENYREFFQKVVTQRGLWYAVQHTSFEPLFTALTFLLSRLTRDPQILFVVTALFSFAVSGRFFARYSQAPCFSLYLFFTLQIFDFYISGIRQAIAIAVLLLAYEALDKGHNVRSLLLILLAGLFHRTAWLWFPVFFLLRIRRRRTFVWVTGLSGMVCLVGARYLVRVIAAIVPRYQLYFGSSYLQSGAKLSLMLYFLVFGLMLLVGELLRGQGDVSVQGERDFRLSSLLLLVCILGYTAPIFSRFLQYFSAEPVRLFCQSPASHAGPHPAAAAAGLSAGLCGLRLHHPSAPHPGVVYHLSLCVLLVSLTRQGKRFI